MADSAAPRTEFDADVERLGR
jgi:hypothetical protein